MKKCNRCGKEVNENIELCDNCGYDFEEGKRTAKLFKKPQDPTNYQSRTDLFDYPILAFSLGILSLIIPIYLFSFLAINISKKPYKPSLEPFSKLGKVFGYFGLLISTLFVGYILFNYIF